MRRAAIVLALLALPGCFKYSQPACLTVSTSPLEPGTYTEVGSPVTGEASAGLLFGIPLGDVDSARTARDRALAASGADALINVSMSYIVRNYLGFYTVTDTYLRGQPVRLNAPAPPDGR